MMPNRLKIACCEMSTERRARQGAAPVVVQRNLAARGRVAESSRAGVGRLALDDVVKVDNDDTLVLAVIPRA